MGDRLTLFFLQNVQINQDLDAGKQCTIAKASMQKLYAFSQNPSACLRLLLLNISISFLFNMVTFTSESLPEIIIFINIFSFLLFQTVLKLLSSFSLPLLVTTDIEMVINKITNQSLGSSFSSWCNTSRTFSADNFFDSLS